MHWPLALSVAVRISLAGKVLNLDPLPRVDRLLSGICYSLYSPLMYTRILSAYVILIFFHMNVHIYPLVI